MDKSNIKKVKIGFIIGIAIIIIIGVTITLAHRSEAKAEKVEEDFRINVGAMKLNNDAVLETRIIGLNLNLNLIVKDNITPHDMVGIYEEFIRIRMPRASDTLYVVKKGNILKTIDIYGLDYLECGCVGVRTNLSHDTAYCKKHQEERDEEMKDFDVEQAQENIRKRIEEKKNSTSSKDSNTTPSYTSEPSNDEKAFAWTAATMEVKKKLKSPSTAKFPFSYNNEHIKKSGSGKFQVISYVDAENSFGATIRTNFVVEIEKTGNESYKIIAVTMVE